jgi:hypothetical protein
MHVMGGARRDLALKACVKLVNLGRPQLLQQPIAQRRRRLDVCVE